MLKGKKYAGQFFGRLLVFFLASVYLVYGGVAVLAAEESAPAVINDVSGIGAGFSSILYDSSKGLPTSEANDIIQTDDGFIWIGSYSGLIRYDGTEFYRFDASTGVASVVSLFADSRQRIWVGTNDGGVACYENDNFTFYTKADGLKASSIRSIQEDNEGNIIIATTLGMAYVDPEGKLHAIDDSRINAEYVCELRKGPDGIIYGETLAGDFFSFDKLKIKTFIKGNDLGFGAINCISPDKDKPGYIYLGTEDNKVLHGKLSDKFTDVTTHIATGHDCINAVVPIDNSVWVCTDNGIGFFDETDHYIPLRNIPMNNSIDNMIRDYEGNLWFVSSRQGVMKIAVNQFSDISLIAGLPSMVVNSTCKRGEDLYLGTDKGLTVLDSQYHVKETELSELLEGVRIRSIKSDSKGNLWFSTFSEFCLVLLRPDDTYEIFNEESGLSSPRIRNTEELSDGSIAVGTSGGVNIIKDGKVVRVYDGKFGLKNTEILSIAQGKDGTLYFGSDGDGIYVVKGDSLSRLGVENGLHSEVVMRIKYDEYRDLFWLVTSNSIAYMQDEEITTVDHFPYPNNFDIFFDKNGGIWVLASNGIYIVNGDDMVKNDHIAYTFYDTMGGLPTITTANSRNEITEDGNLYISGTTGVASININEVRSLDHKIKLSVPFVNVDGDMIPVEEDGTVNIPAKSKRVSIDGYVLTYSLTNPIVRYSLEGFDNDVVESTKEEMETAVYTNLPGGEYTYHLAVIDTLTGDESDSITIRILKNKMLTEYPLFWVFLALLFTLFVVLLLLLFFRHRTKKLKEQALANRRLVNQLSKTFGKVIDLKDSYTNGHSARVAKYTRLIAKEMGYSQEEVDRIYNIALLHDVGKIGIPDSILNKPGKLDDDEFHEIQTHAAKGFELLSDFKDLEPELAYGAGYHHEKYDGSGYPRGLKGDEIPEVAQIIAVADTFDAMYSTRPYRKQMPLEKVISEIERVAGTQLSPKPVEAFIRVYKAGAIEEVAKTTA
ncbi:MAG: HD domain-containing protein [Lachnospiraceae bacterium]|nr:HD domain-containing protein [Lachnospiraceae bacterium]